MACGCSFRGPYSCGAAGDSHPFPSTPSSDRFQTVPFDDRGNAARSSSFVLLQFEYDGDLHPARHGPAAVPCRMELPASDRCHGRGVEKVETRGPVHRDPVGPPVAVHLHLQQGGSLPSCPPRLPGIFRLEHPRVADPGQGVCGFRTRPRRYLPFIAASAFDARGGGPAMTGFVRRLARRCRGCGCHRPTRCPGGLRRPVHVPPWQTWNFLPLRTRRLPHHPRFAGGCRRNGSSRCRLRPGTGFRSRPLRSVSPLRVPGGLRGVGSAEGVFRLVGFSPRAVQQTDPQGLKGAPSRVAGVHGERQRQECAMKQGRAQQAVQKTVQRVSCVTSRSASLPASFVAGCGARIERTRALQVNPGRLHASTASRVHGARSRTAPDAGTRPGSPRIRRPAGPAD